MGGLAQSCQFFSSHERVKRCLPFKINIEYFVSGIEFLCYKFCFGIFSTRLDIPNAEIRHMIEFVFVYHLNVSRFAILQTESRLSSTVRWAISGNNIAAQLDTVSE